MCISLHPGVRVFLAALKRPEALRLERDKRKQLKNSQVAVALREVLKEKRIQAKLEGSVVSRLLGRERGFAYLVESGRRTLDSVELFEYCQACGTTVAEVAAAVERRVTLKRLPFEPAAAKSKSVKRAASKNVRGASSRR